MCIRDQRRPGRTDRSKVAQALVAARLHPGLHTGGDKGRTGAEEGDPGLLGQPPEGTEVGMAGVAVVQNQGGTEQQSRGEEVPHHPAGRAEPEEPVVWAEVAVQGECLVVLEQDAAVAVHEALGQPGGARGIEDPEWMVERHGGELRLGPDDRFFWFSTTGWM